MIAMSVQKEDSSRYTNTLHNARHSIRRAYVAVPPIKDGVIHTMLCYSNLYLALVYYRQIFIAIDIKLIQ